MNADDFRVFTIEELDKQIAIMKKQLFDMRMDLHTNQLQNTNKVRDTKRNIARALTVRKELVEQALSAQSVEN